MYYIQNKKAGFLGNAVMFWAQDSKGYTADLDKSHKFTESEAKKICEGNPEKNVAWPAEYIDSNEGVLRVVDHQYLEPKNIKKF